MVQIRNLTYSIGTLNLLREVDLTIGEMGRIALVGANGAGKTTLLRLIYGELKNYQGEIYKPKNIQTGYLPQEEMTIGGGEVLQNVMQGKKEITEIESAVKRIRLALSEGSGNKDQLLEEVGSLETRFELAGGYRLRNDAQKILMGLGFAETDFQRQVSEFSGGWRMRIHLARLLLQDPDLLLLDEPTNHLDIQSLEWLENYLKSYRGSIILVSHDRFFIDRLANEIAELEDGKLTRYFGKYHDFERQKQAALKNLKAQKTLQEKELTHQQRFIDRFRYKATKAAQVQSRIKQLEKIKEIEIPNDRDQIRFQIKVETPSFKDVLQIKNMSFRYDDSWIFKDLNLKVYRGEKIALIGPNGSGKTTLTRLITRQLIPRQGAVVHGEKVKIGYYAQHQIENLNLRVSIFDEIASSSAESNRPYLREILGLFHFSGDDIYKKISVLSGGEKARVSLAKILVSPVNFLIMDEPTNHLDIGSRQALEDALTDYDGTLLLISHDRYFLDKLVNRVFGLHNGGIQIFEGNYSDYLKNREATESEEVNRETGEKQNIKKSDKLKERKRREAEARQFISKERNRLEAEIRELEAQVEELELEKSELEKRIGHPETYSDGEQVAQIQIRYRDVRKILEELMHSWEYKNIEYEELLESLRSGMMGGE